MTSASTSASLAATAPSASTSASSEPSAPVAMIADREGIGLALGPQGHLGAWLALGPFRIDADRDAWPLRLQVPRDHDERDRALEAPVFKLEDAPPKLDASIAIHADRRERALKGTKPSGPWRWRTDDGKWRLVHSVPGSDSGPGVDLAAAMNAQGANAIAYVAAVVRLPVAQKLFLMVGVDDGLEVIVDGTSRFERDADRPMRADDDIVPLDLSAGDHTLVLKLRQRGGDWRLRARLVDEGMRAPTGVRVLLPTSDEESVKQARIELAKAMSVVSFERALRAGGWWVDGRVAYPDGTPLGIDIPVRLAVVAPDGSDRLPAREHVLRVGGPRYNPMMVEPTDDLSAEAAAHATLTLRADVAGRRVESAFRPRKELRDAIEAVDAARTTVDGCTGCAPIADDVRATLAHLAARLAHQLATADIDLAAQDADAAELRALATDVAAGIDPIAKLRGPHRLAHVARADGKPQEVAVYVPPSIDKLSPGKKLPLYVGLHGMNGGDMAMLRVFFGGDDDKLTMAELDRRVSESGTVRDIDAFVVAPNGHGNAMYRQLGEVEVLDAIAWAMKRWPQIDPDRVYVTGFSMGGIGAASIPLHHPDLFAAAEPLCGYHDYGIRRDIAGRPHRPWEDFLIAERSNVRWAENGWRLPLHIVHGTIDVPEENSGRLIERYERLKFTVDHEHPKVGHDVWGLAYAKLRQLDWFRGRRRDPHPRRIVLETTRPRFGDDAWLHVEALARWDEWANVEATAEPGRVSLTTKNVSALRLDRDAVRVGAGKVRVTIDGAKIDFDAGAPIALHRVDKKWIAGADERATPRKSGTISGPIRDAWSEPLTFVYGASDPDQEVANRAVAEALASVRWGTDVSYPIVADTTIDPEAAPKTSIVAIGNAKSNRLVRAYEASLPIRLEGDRVRVGDRLLSGDGELGAAFVVPHPRAGKEAPAYLVVVEGVTWRGTLRALSLPDLIPDFVVFDGRVAPSRGLPILTNGALLAGGFFDGDWKLPSVIDDPLWAAMTDTKRSREKDGTAYLP